MRISAADNVGIGIATPEAPLDVRVPSTTSTDLIAKYSAGGFDLDILGNNANVVNTEVYRLGMTLGANQNGSMSFWRGNAAGDGWR